MHKNTAKNIEAIIIDNIAWKINEIKYFFNQMNINLQHNKIHKLIPEK